MELYNNRILIIDDNEAIHEDFKKALSFNSENINADMDALENILSDKKSEVQQFPVLIIDSAYQGQTGLQLIKNAIDKGIPYALAFVDIRMPPGWDGVETIEQIWKTDPNIQTVICSAYSDYSWEALFNRIGHSDRLLIIKKPFDMVEIRLFALALTKKWMFSQQAQLKLEQLQNLVDQKTKELVFTLNLTKTTLESTADGIITIGKDNNIINYNKKFIDMWNVPKSLLTQNQTLSITEIMKTQLATPNEFFFNTQKMISENDFGHYREIQLKNTKTVEYLEEYTHPQYDQNGITGMVYSFRDVTARKHLEQELITQATYDHLTGLPNRVLFVDRVQQAILNAKRNGQFLAILFADLDSFKYVNDSFGHDVGDSLLKLFAKRLKNALRESDSVVRFTHTIEMNTAARLGGDEFLILLTMDSLDTEQIENIIQRLCNTLLKPYHLANHSLTVTLSIGVSIYPQDGDNPMILIKNADIAMYRAKEKGNGSFEFYTNEMSGKQLIRLELENDLRHALEHNELSLHYQPLVDMKKKHIVSLEVLMRWQHPKLGFIAPTLFIPVAEASGLIIPMGTWALQTACAQNKAWQDRGLPNITIAVNISGHQFKQHNFVDLIKNILQDTGLEGKYLELELTESVLFSDISELLLKLQQLKDLGISINLDDFGTGYSSLSYINQFPIDKLKIDQSFIKNLSQKRESQTIVEAVMMIAKSFKMIVVAEGVETAEQLNALGHLATDQVQGYYLSKPMSVTDTTALLENPWEWPRQEKLIK